MITAKLGIHPRQKKMSSRVFAAEFRRWARVYCPCFVAGHARRSGWLGSKGGLVCGEAGASFFNIYLITRMFKSSNLFEFQFVELTWTGGLLPRGSGRARAWKQPITNTSLRRWAKKNPAPHCLLNTSWNTTICQDRLGTNTHASDTWSAGWRLTRGRCERCALRAASLGNCPRTRRSSRILPYRWPKRESKRTNEVNELS